MICEANALKCKATASIAEGVESGLALMANLQYLTVQDMLWINLQTTKKVQHFQYAKLDFSGRPFSDRLYSYAPVRSGE